MKKEVNGYNVPIKLWLDEIEQSCMEQVYNLAMLPFVFKHVAIMPDAHTGKGMPIGGVLATKGVIIPNAVGVDIGCGMCAVKTNLKASELKREQITQIMRHVRKNVPLGCEHQKKALDEALLADIDFDSLYFLKDKKKNCLEELGTLGGGNHFIELQRDTNTDDLWVMIHSGSRHVGLTVAEHYNKIAQMLNEKWFSESLPGLAFMPIEDEHAKRYLEDMKFCVEFAFRNRSIMMQHVMNGIESVDGNAVFEPMINIAHNYAAFENHFGEDVIVHRKGATRAYKGEIGIIPGSMGTCSYIVEGLGNPESFMSCSHGAGRKLSRGQALKTLDLEQESAQMEANGIIHGLRKTGLDEAPGAYKDIEQVIENELDLIKPIVQLFPIAVIKGD